MFGKSGTTLSKLSAEDFGVIHGPLEDPSLGLYRGYMGIMEYKWKLLFRV